MRQEKYVHGYSQRETRRLSDQANTLAELLHGGTRYRRGSKVLEAGCGTGAQTVILAENSPETEIVSVDLSTDSIEKAREHIEEKGITNVTFSQADIFDLPFEDDTFDHVFVCFVLEHLAAPLEALVALKRVLKPGGSLTAIEGDHGSTFFHPRCEEANQAVQCLIDLQAKNGGDALVGRRLYPLLREAGFSNVAVSPKFVYVDSSRPTWVEGFTKNTFTAMVEGVKRDVLACGMMEELAWDRGIAGLYRAAESDGVFCYTFFKGTGIK
jgi:SAM-dependent methyltransferase